MSLSFQDIKNEIAKRRPDELPVVLVTPNKERRTVIGFFFDSDNAEWLCLNRESNRYDLHSRSQEHVGKWEILPIPKKKKVLYQAVFDIMERIEVSQFLFATEHEAKLFYKECFVSLLTDRPIVIEEE